MTYIHTLLILCIQQVTNKNLLPSSENPYSMLCGGLNGKEIKKRVDICICIADPLCYIAEINTTLQSNYTPLKIN